MSQKIYEILLWKDQICKSNILKLEHQNHWKQKTKKTQKTEKKFLW